jgi:hypothetical protein
MRLDRAGRDSRRLKEGTVLNVHRIIRSLAIAPALAAIWIAAPAASLAQLGGAAIKPIPSPAKVGQVVNIEVHFASECTGAHLSFGDGTPDLALTGGGASFLGAIGQHKYAAAGTFSLRSYFAPASTSLSASQSAKYATDCKGASATLQVLGTGGASASGFTPGKTVPMGIGISPILPAPGQAMTFILQYNGDCAGARMSFGDGTPDQPLAQGTAGQRMNISHTYAKAGSYTAGSYYASGNAANSPELVAKFTANCKGGPVNVPVHGAGATGNATPPAPPTSPNVNTTASGTPCNDGTTSNTTGKGACAHHGGIAAASASANTPPNTPPAPPTPPNTNTTGTPCNDGTISNTTGKGACAHHGGMASANNTPNTPPAPPASPNPNTTGTPCNDGTTSNTTGKGACAHHGGIKSANTSPNTPPNTPPAPPASPNTNTTGTPCNDGTTSNLTGKGACEHHGGIKQPSAPPAA